MKRRTVILNITRDRGVNIVMARFFKIYVVASLVLSCGKNKSSSFLMAQDTATSLRGMLGFHDCNAANSQGTPRVGSRCDKEWQDFMNQMGSGWLAAMGHYGGIGGIPARDPDAILDLSSVPKQVKILLRIEQSPGSSAPSILNETLDYDQYALGLARWLQLPENNWRQDLVEYIQLGNEFEQTHDAYPNWTHSGPDKYLQYGVGPCENPHGVKPRPNGEKYIQMVTPERYAKYFVAVRKALDNHGFQDKKLVLYPRMPDHWWWHGQYFASTKKPTEPDFRLNNQKPCMAIVRNIGDYLLAIEKEAINRGFSPTQIQNLVAGISIHFQGVTSYNQAIEWFGRITRGIEETSVLREEIKDGGNKIEFSSWSTASVKPSYYRDIPLFISEIHPQPPLWQHPGLDPWFSEVFRAFKDYNSGLSGGRNPIKMITLYRWGKDGSSVQDGQKTKIKEFLLKEGAI